MKCFTFLFFFPFLFPFLPLFPLLPQPPPQHSFPFSPSLILPKQCCTRGKDQVQCFQLTCCVNLGESLTLSIN